MGATAFELGVGLADLRQRVDVRDRRLQVTVGDQVSLAWPRLPAAAEVAIVAAGYYYGLAHFVVTPLMLPR